MRWWWRWWRWWWCGDVPRVNVLLLIITLEEGRRSYQTHCKQDFSSLIEKSKQSKCLQSYYDFIDKIGFSFCRQMDFNDSFQFVVIICLFPLVLLLICSSWGRSWPSQDFCVSYKTSIIAGSQCVMILLPAECSHQLLLGCHSVNISCSYWQTLQWWVLQIFV